MATPALALRLTPGRRRVAANAAALVLAYALPRAITLAAAVVAARVLGAAAFGVYATAAAVAVVASIAATLGMQPLLVREVARDVTTAPRLLSAAHTAKLGTVVLMAALLAAAGPVFGFPPAVAAASALLGAGYALGAFVENLAAYYQGIERMHVWTQASTIVGLVGGGLGVALVLRTHSVLWFCAAPAVGQGAALAWLLAGAPRAIRRPPRPAAAEVRRLLRMLAPFAAAYVATTIYYRADVLLLSRWRTAAEVGLYGAAYKFLDVAQALALAGAGALLPRLSRRLGTGEEGAARPALAAAFLFAAPVALALFFLRDRVIAGVFGPGYAGAVPVLALLAPAVVPLVLNMFALSALAAADAMRDAALLFAGATALNVTLNVLWIPTHGATGAAAATLVSEPLLALGLHAALRRRRAA